MASYALKVQITRLQEFGEGADLNFDGPLPALKGFNKHVYSTDDDRSLQSIFWTFLCPLPRASKKHILFYCCAVQRAAKEHRA